ncbi:hypothetical protein BJF78_05875 [Pseudonocardia sp. CNS-139]|nr:hypothetical protein BJF78_05875 [Pseudonocardia sp. CNS-139]
MLRASRVGMLSTRYEISEADAVLCTWKPTAFFGGGEFVLDGRRFEVTRGGWTGRRYRLFDETGEQVATADGVGRLAWTLETGGVTYSFERTSLFRNEHVLAGEPGSVRRTSAWFGEAEADLPGLPQPVQVFVLASLLSVWDED